MKGPDSTGRCAELSAVDIRTSDRAGATFLDRLSPTDRRELLAQGRRIRLRAGTTGLIEGQVSGQVLILLEGHIRACVAGADGRVSLLAVRRPGDIVGELSALDGRPHSATVTAFEQVEALAISASSFRDFLKTHPDATLAVLELVTERLRDADRKRAEFGSMDAAGRLAARLVELADQHGQPSGSGVRIDLALSQEELASWVGASREAVSRGLRMFRERGWIATRRRGITVLDVEGLRARAV